MSSEMVPVEIVVPPVPKRTLRALPVSEADEAWDHFYCRAYRKVFRVGAHHGSKLSADIYLPAHKAALIADWVLWKKIPAGERPEDWPQTEEEFARRVGCHPLSILKFVGKYGIYRWLEEPAWVGVERIRQVDEALFSATLSALEVRSKEAPALAKTFYLRTGAIKQGATTNVQIGPKVEIHGDVDQSKWLARMKALLPYLEEREAFVVPSKELSDGSSEKDSSRGVDGAGEAGDGPEVRSEPGEPA